MASASSTRPAAQPADGLIKGLGLVSSTSIVVGVMIGSGIFIFTPLIARQVGSPFLMLLVWALAGFLTVMGALCFAELATSFPEAGGQYVYIRESLGPLFGFLYGWTVFLVIQTGGIASVSLVFAEYLGEVVPRWVSSSHWLFRLGSVGPAANSHVVGLNTVQIVALAVVLLVAWLNSRGVKTGAAVQNLFTFAKVAGLLGIIVLGLIVARNYDAIGVNFSNHFFSGLSWHGSYNLSGAIGGPLTAMSTVTILFAAMVGAVFSMEGWNTLTFAAGEVSEPRRNLPRALGLGTLAVTGLYLLANVAYLCTLPFTGDPHAPGNLGRGIQFASGDRVAGAMLHSIYGDLGSLLIAVAVILATFGCANGQTLGGARIYYAMAKDGLFFPAAAELNSHRVPGVAIWMQALWACLLVLSGRLSELLSYTMFAVFVFYILTVVGLIVLRRKRPNLARPYRVFAYPVLPVVYILMCGFFDLQVLRAFPVYAGGGLIIVLLGVPAYFLWRSGSNRRLAVA